MQFLKNSKAWTNMARGRPPAAAPKEFPCLAIDNTDWSTLKFLYADDIFKLAMRFRAEIKL